MNDREATIGRAQTVLVTGSESDPVGVVSSVLAHVRDGLTLHSRNGASDPGERLRDRNPSRVRFEGPAQFDDASRRHITEVVLPFVDRLLRELNVPARDFSIGLLNLGAASVADIGLRVSGFSADVPVFLALLSAAMEMPLPQNTVSTGHFASPVGDIGLVKHIPAKLTAAMAEPSLKTFVLPSLESDSSLERLSPEERRRAAEAILEAREHIRIVAVGNGPELLEAVFADETIVLAGLRHGFFSTPGDIALGASTATAVARFLTADLESRFWAALERHLFAGEGVAAKALLSARVRFEVSRPYPSGFGRRLYQLVGSLPPATRRFKITFPLLPMVECIRLAQSAGESDHEDVRLLIDAAGGRPRESSFRPGPVGEASALTASAASATLELVLDEMNAETLAQTIGSRIDTARAAYVMEDVTTESPEVFYDTVSAFYLAMLRHTRDCPEPMDTTAVASEANALLERAFAHHGGPAAAISEAQYGTRGGMRFVLDVLTERFKTEEQTKHVNRVLRQALNPLDWSGKVAFMAELMNRIGPQLPPEVAKQPAERYAKHYEVVVRAYVESVDKLRQLLRNL